ncbi:MULTISPECIES: flippase-like domain-containing protein [Chitinophagaceae]
MGSTLNIQPILVSIKKKWKIYLQVALAVFFIIVAARFFSEQKYEVRSIKNVLRQSSWDWVVVGVVLTLAFVVLQGLMYVYSFEAIGKKVSLWRCTILFLKRNFISVFLPAGGITSLAFFNREIHDKNIKKSHIQASSAIYAVVGILSVVLVAIPALCFSFSSDLAEPRAWIALAVLIVFFLLLFLLFKDLKRKGKTYSWLTKHSSGFEEFVHAFKENEIDKRGIYGTIIVSIVIDIIGIGQLYCAMYAMELAPTLYLASITYIVAVLLLIVSPFLRGIGAIDVSVVYILQKAGFTAEQSLAATVLFRLFEFWIPLLLGAVSLLARINQFVLRIIPAIFLFLLGVINITSALTPPIHERFKMVHEFFSIKMIHTSNYFVLMAGLFLIMNALFLLRGSRTAYLTAIVLCCVSILGNLLKSFDYEEAIVATVTLATLIIKAKDYKIRPKMNLSNRYGLILGISFCIVLVYSFIGIYYCNNKFWHLPLTFQDRLEIIGRNLLLLKNPSNLLVSSISKYFLFSINMWSFLNVCYILFVLFRPKYLAMPEVDTSSLHLAKDMLYRMYQSPNDYFKIWKDKQIYFLKETGGFVSFKTYKTYAVVLETPVVSYPEQLQKAIAEFESYCQSLNLRSFYYRVPEDALNAFQNLKKKKVLIGQEALLDVKNFSLSGKSKKSLRNAVNHAQASGLKVIVNHPPIKDGLLQRLESVSNEWLNTNDRKEIVFSQGSFDWGELKTQLILTVENEEGMVLAFLNMMPSFGRKDVTYDLIRYVEDAPNGIVDFMLIEFFKYLQENGYDTVDIGFAPFSGLDEIDSKNFLERSMEFTYEKVKPIANYQQGLRRAKDKFEPEWQNRYLIYSEDFDLIQFPIIYNKIVKA